MFVISLQLVHLVHKSNGIPYFTKTAILVLAHENQSNFKSISWQVLGIDENPKLNNKNKIIKILTEQKIISLRLILWVVKKYCILLKTGTVSLSNLGTMCLSQNRVFVWILFAFCLTLGVRWFVC